MPVRIFLSVLLFTSCSRCNPNYLSFLPLRSVPIFRSLKDEMAVRQLWKGMIRVVKMLIFSSDAEPKAFVPAFANSLVLCCKQLTKPVFHGDSLCTRQTTYDRQTNLTNVLLSFFLFLARSKHETKFLIQCMRFVRQSLEWWFFQSKWWSSTSHNPPNDHFTLIQ